MARGTSRAQSERTLRQLGGGSDEIAQYRASQRASSNYSKIGTKLESVGRQAAKSPYAVALGVKEEISAFNKGMADRLKALVDSGDRANFAKEVGKMVLESEQKLAEVRARTGILGELPVEYRRQDAESFMRFYADTNVSMATAGKGPDKQTFLFIGDQLRARDEFTFKDNAGNKVKITELGEPRPLKDLGDRLAANIDLGAKVYVIPDEYYKRGEPNIND
jgi:hypothetical protein